MQGESKRSLFEDCGRGSLEGYVGPVREALFLDLCRGLSSGARGFGMYGHQHVETSSCPWLKVRLGRHGWLVGWFTVLQDKLADKAKQQLSLQCDVVRRGPQRRVSSAAPQLLRSAPLAPTTSCEVK